MKNQQQKTVKSVLQVNVLGATLSTGRTTREMHNYFLQNNIKSYIACPIGEDCNDAFVYHSLTGTRISKLCSLITGYEMVFSVLETRKLIRYIESISPDIVHLRVLHGEYVNIRMLLSYLGKKDIPTVITLHDMWYLTGKCFHYSNLHCQKWQKHCGKCPFIPTEKRKPLFDKTKQMLSLKKQLYEGIRRLAVIGVSDWTTCEARKSIMASAPIIRRIYNWIDLDSFYPRDVAGVRKKYGIGNRKVILGISAKWSFGGHKGLEHYLKLAEKLPQTHCIILVGCLIYNGVLPDNIIMIGRIDDKEELAEIYSMADVYLNLSTQETFGKVSAEAIACGTPVVAYDATANREIVPPGGGLLLHSFEEEEILRAVIEITSKDKSVFIDICRNYACNYFNKDTNIRAYIDMYNELINL